MRVVLDTNVLVRATKSAAGPARKLLATLSFAPHAIVTSSGLLAELMRVLEYPRLRAQHRLSRTEIEAFIGGLFRIAEVVPLQPGKIGTTVPADPEDDLVIRTAVQGKADVVCALDRHFQHPDVRVFCAPRGIQILSDMELLRILAEARAFPARERVPGIEEWEAPNTQQDNVRGARPGQRKSGTLAAAKRQPIDNPGLSRRMKAYTRHFVLSELAPRAGPCC